MTNAKIRGAVVGVGYLGTFHAQKYAANPFVELVGVVDPRPEQAEKVATQLGVKGFSNPQDLIGKVDAVTIASTTQTHFELAKLFLQNNVHVNVEKPITVTTAQAQELIELAKSKNLKLSVGHIERFNPALREMRKFIQSPYLIELNRWATFKPRGADVSVVHDLMIHDIDILLSIDSSGVESITATGEKYLTSEWDVATACLKFKSGLTGLINVSRVSHVPRRDMRVMQKGHFFQVNLGSLEIEKITPVANTETPFHVEKWQAGKADALQKETDSFIASIVENKPVEISGEDGLRALDLVERVCALIEKGHA